MGEPSATDKTIRCITDKQEFHRIIDELSEDALALLVVRTRREESDQALSVRSYGVGRQTDFLALWAYAQAQLYIEYYVDDVNAPEDD